MESPQRFIKEPRIKVDDILTILDGVKADIRAAEGLPEKQEFKGTATETTTAQATPAPSKKKNNTKKNTTT